MVRVDSVNVGPGAVVLCLGALALLCWPAGGARLRLDTRSSAPVTPASGTAALTAGSGPRRGADGLRRVGLRRRGGRLPGERSVVGRAGWVLGVAAISAVALSAGWVVSGAVLLIAATVARLTSSELASRRESKQIGTLLVATRTLAREVRTGADPVAAVRATAAAHPPCAAALDRLAAVVVGSGGDPGRSAGVRAAGVRSGGRMDQHAEVMARLGDGWQLSVRYGVPWAALIETVATDLDDRRRAESLRTAQVAGPRVSGYVLAVMPALGILLGAGMGADPLHVLLATGVGGVLLLVGSALTCLGLAWTAAIVRR